MFIQHRVKDGYDNDKNLGPLKTRRKKGIHKSTDREQQHYMSFMKEITTWDQFKWITQVLHSELSIATTFFTSLPSFSRADLSLRRLKFIYLYPNTFWRKSNKKDVFNNKYQEQVRYLDPGVTRAPSRARARAEGLTVCRELSFIWDPEPKEKVRQRLMKPRHRSRPIFVLYRLSSL